LAGIANKIKEIYEAQIKAPANNNAEKLVVVKTILEGLGEEIKRGVDYFALIPHLYKSPSFFNDYGANIVGEVFEPGPVYMLKFDDKHMAAGRSIESLYKSCLKVTTAEGLEYSQLINSPVNANEVIFEVASTESKIAAKKLNLTAEAKGKLRFNACDTAITDAIKYAHSKKIELPYRRAKYFGALEVGSKLVFALESRDADTLYYQCMMQLEFVKLPPLMDEITFTSGLGTDKNAFYKDTLDYFNTKKKLCTRAVQMVVENAN